MLLKKTVLYSRPVVILFCLSCFIFSAFVAYTFAADKHEEDMGKMSCITCHEEVTPDIVKQWRESAHGYTLNRCGVCHGDQKNFRVTPDKNVCMSCHSLAVKNHNLKGKACTECHESHHFSQHRIKDYLKKSKGESK